MIKPVHSAFDASQSIPLSAAKPRSGLSRIGDLIPRLIRSYELQAEAARKRQQQASRLESRVRRPETHVTCITDMNQQTTFAWFE